jgi:hypothetical protein
MRGYLSNQNGWFKPVVTLILVTVLAYAGFKFSIPYYHYHSFKSEAREIARLYYSRPERYQELLCESAEGIGVPIECSDIHVGISNKRVTVRAAWSETADLMGYYQKTFHFRVDLTE